MVKDEEFKKLKNEFDAQERKIEKQETTIKKLEKEMKTFMETFKNHTHSGNDGSNKYFQSNIELKPGSTFKTGNFSMEEYTDKDGIVTGSFSIGANSRGSGLSNIIKDGTQIYTVHQSTTNGTTNQTFMQGIRSPVYVSTGIGAVYDSGGTVLSQSEFTWQTDELVGAYVIVYSSTSVFDMFEITSNTATTLTISGTFPSRSTGNTFEIFVPVYFGSAQHPWRRLYTIDGSGGGIRFGGGDTNGGQNALLYTDGANLKFRKKDGSTVNII